MKTVCDVLGVARSNVAIRTRAPLAKPLGRPPQPEADLLAEIKAVIGNMPTYGYRRVWAILRRAAKAQGLQSPNHKRVYRVMKAHGLLLQRHVGGAEERRHEGRIAVDRSNLRWCSDGFELACDNGEKVRVAFALDCCDREIMGFVATTEGIKGEDVRDLMVTAVEHRFGRINRLPQTIEWLTDNGSGCHRPLPLPPLFSFRSHSVAVSLPSALLVLPSFSPLFPPPAPVRRLPPARHQALCS